MKHLSFSTKEEFITATAKRVIDVIEVSIRANNKANIAVSGGNTPLELFELLSQKFDTRVDWRKVSIWWVDERWVSKDDPGNNFNNASKSGLAKLGSPTYPMKTNLENPEISAKEYSMLLKRSFEGFPIFDLILIGAGTDGHTASLFSNNMDLIKESNWVVSTLNPHNLQKRISLNFNVIIGAENLFLLLSGEVKRSIFELLLVPNTDLPIQWVMKNAKMPLVLTCFD